MRGLRQVAQSRGRITQSTGEYLLALSPRDGIQDSFGNPFRTSAVATWHQDVKSLLYNEPNPYDVNHDGFVKPNAALAVINALLLPAAVQTVYVDVDGSNRVTPRDALRVINVLLMPNRYEALQLMAGSELHTNLLQGGERSGVLIEQPDGAAIFRARGIGADDWGSSYCFGPYIAGVGSNSSRGAITQAIATPEGVAVRAIGDVSGPRGAIFGDRQWQAMITYDLALHGVNSRDGVLDIHLSDDLTSADGDLNLGLINSNYLVGVPLQEPANTIGDTGDMRFVRVYYEDAGSPHEFTWTPNLQNPRHFPTEVRASSLRFSVVGARNVVSSGGKRK